jgi:hypothetical protein
VNASITLEAVVVGVHVSCVAVVVGVRCCFDVDRLLNCVLFIAPMRRVLSGLQLSHVVRNQRLRHGSGKAHQKISEQKCSLWLVSVCVTLACTFHSNDQHDYDNHACGCRKLAHESRNFVGHKAVILREAIMFLIAHLTWN